MSGMGPINHFEAQDLEDPYGALLIAEYGDGYFIYTGLSFFRELPAGVPGPIACLQIYYL